MKTYHNKSASKLQKSPKTKSEMNLLVRLSKRTHDVNVQKGKVLTRLQKGTVILNFSVFESTLVLGVKASPQAVQGVIVEQADIIEEYHKHLKEVLEKNEALERQLQFLRKERQLSNSGGKSRQNSARKRRDDTLGNAAHIHISDNNYTESKIISPISELISYLGDYKTPAKANPTTY